jgi:hypothetical protein
MILITKFTGKMENKRFASANVQLEKRKKRISSKYNGTYGIHSISVSNPELCIKVWADNPKEIPMKVQKAIVAMGGRFLVKFIQSETEHPDQYHLEDLFEL